MSAIQNVDFLAIAPPLILAVAAIGVLVVDAFLPARASRLVGDGALAGVALSLATSFALVLDGLPRRTFCVVSGAQGAGPV
jgi:NADH-quinone oxidoreductase subunit N